MKCIMTGGKYYVSEIGYWKNSSMVIIISFQDYYTYTANLCQENTPVTGDARSPGICNVGINLVLP